MSLVADPESRLTIMKLEFQTLCVAKPHKSPDNIRQSDTNKHD